MVLVPSCIAILCSHISVVQFENRSTIAHLGLFFSQDFTRQELLIINHIHINLRLPPRHYLRFINAANLYRFYTTRGNVDFFFFFCILGKSLETSSLDLPNFFFSVLTFDDIDNIVSALLLIFSLLFEWRSISIADDGVVF